MAYALRRYLMTRKPLVLGASALLLALPLLAVPAVASKLIANDAVGVKAEAATIVAIRGSENCSNDSSNSRYRIYVDIGAIHYGKTYSGVYYDADGGEHSATITNVGRNSTNEYHMLNIPMSTMLPKIILKKDTVFTCTDDSTETFSFDKDYMLTFGINYQPAIVQEYTGSPVSVATLSISSGLKTGQAEKFYRWSVSERITAQGRTYTGAIHDYLGNEYSASIYTHEITTYTCTISSWTDHLIIRKTDIFTQSDDSNFTFHFDKDYLLTFVKNYEAPAIVEYTASAEADYFVKTYMHPEIEATDMGTGKCLGTDGYYAKAKAAYQKLSADAKNLFDTDSNYAAYKARYDAWASFNEGIDTGSKSALGRMTKEGDCVIPVIASLSLAVGVSVAAMLFLRKKRSNR